MAHAWDTPQYRQASKALRARALPCWLCGQPIDYAAPARSPQSFSVDHEVSRHNAAHLGWTMAQVNDPGNLRPAHLGCNASRKAGPPPPPKPPSPWD